MSLRTGVEGPFSDKRLSLLRRYAREAARTYVGRHWPTSDDMRRDGIGYGLVEDRQHEHMIRRYLDLFQPDVTADMLDVWMAERKDRAAHVCLPSPEALAEALIATEREVARQGVYIGLDANLSDYAEAILARLRERP